MTPTEFIFLYRVYLGWLTANPRMEPLVVRSVGDVASYVYQHIPADRYQSLHTLSFQNHPCL